MRRTRKHQLFRRTIASGTTQVPCKREYQQITLSPYLNQPKIKLVGTSNFTLNLASPKSQIFTSRL